MRHPDTGLCPLVLFVLDGKGSSLTKTDADDWGTWEKRSFIVRMSGNAIVLILVPVNENLVKLAQPEIVRPVMYWLHDVGNR